MCRNVQHFSSCSSSVMKVLVDMTVNLFPGLAWKLLSGCSGVIIIIVIMALAEDCAKSPSASWFSLFLAHVAAWKRTQTSIRWQLAGDRQGAEASGALNTKKENV